MEITDVKVKIDNFEGPMDLLLHLVEKEKLSIYEINISKIIDEYIEYVKSAVNNSLEVKVEFLVIASELLEIKSLAVLNKKEKKAKEDELGQKIMEYKRYKEIAAEIEKMENEYRISYTKEGKEITYEISEEIDMSDVTPSRLFIEYKKILEKSIKPEMRLNLDVNFSMEEGIADIKQILHKSKKETPFEEIFIEKENKYRVVIYFLAILEMYKMDAIEIIEKEKVYLRMK